MQREKTNQADESLDLVETIEQCYRGEMQENRLRMLSLLAGAGMVIVGR